MSTLQWWWGQGAGRPGLGTGAQHTRRHGSEGGRCWGAGGCTLCISCTPCTANQALAHASVWAWVLRVGCCCSCGCRGVCRAAYACLLLACSCGGTQICYGSGKAGHGAGALLAPTLCTPPGDAVHHLVYAVCSSPAQPSPASSMPKPTQPRSTHHPVAEMDRSMVDAPGKVNVMVKGVLQGARSSRHAWMDGELA